MKIYSFPRGGLDFDDPTAPIKNETANAFLPALAVMPLGELSARAYPVVSIGEQVREGQLIGRASGAGAVNVHSSIPGRVIRKAAWKSKDGFENEGLVIKMEGAFEKLGHKEENFLWTGMSGYDIQKIISELGVVEMESPARPLAEIISAARKGIGKLTIVVRCVFDDPWLAADYALCRDRLKTVVEGAAIAAKACFRVSQIIYAVSHKEKELGERLLKEAANWEYPAAMMLTSSRYPQRNNRELEAALRIYEKKEGLDLGSFIILGPAVLAAACDAVKNKRPTLDRFVAVGGGAVKNPQVIKTRIGTRIGDVIEQCGGFSETPYKIVTGSVLSGREVIYLDEPVEKICYAVVAMSKAQVSSGEAHNCINCGECRVVCPVGLDPQDIYKRKKSLEFESARLSGCHGCGCCKIVCPSALL